MAALLAIAGVLQAAPERIPASARSKSFEHRPEVRNFIDQMTAQHGFVRSELAAVFRKAIFQPDIIRAITPPADPTARSWHNYRANFVNAQRIEAGRRFRERHAAALQRAAAQYGVPEEIILAIIGVETVYGRNMGRYRVIDALATLAFDYPQRAEFFRSELEHFLLYARDTGSDVLG
ncbi:MAG: lytic murein transglycosylase B, partial [Betaproteobacteria bacterium]|nr:lytic murein transglycosylase B [Betaproteobacteria bacterium]